MPHSTAAEEDISNSTVVSAAGKAPVINGTADNHLIKMSNRKI